MKKVLITDGLKPLFEKSGDTVSRKDIKVISAISGEDIIRIHRSENVDLIIADLNLPEMNGDEACSVIRNDDRLKKVSVIIACDSDQAAIRRCQACSANAFITKPVKPNDLFHKIRKLLYVPDRKDLKIVLHINVERDSESKFLYADLKNISSAGILFESDEHIEKGEKIVCLFFIGNSPVTTNGNIVRIERKARRQNLYGVQFSKLNPDSKDKIDKFVSGHTQHI
jgi:CheY-like chemotaxis protein